ncbi:unnamed protein product [Cylindrotheca closterium]|uniref:Uncharacterized protein n=1 Tax=Cylindrotheca closterium TaxID=2856 RepID=A0AAD2PVU7_9STRA|nr:unnamed protein product [Cylindrotheca closterium]
MVAKGKHRWRKNMESCSPSRRVSSQAGESSYPEAPTNFNCKLNNIDIMEEQKTTHFVRFRFDQSMHDHIRKEDYLPEEKQASFWSAEDLKGMKGEMRKLVHQFQKGHINVEDDCEATIIERYTRKETIERKRRRKGTVRSLLSHQKSFGGELSETWLKKVYISESYKSQQAANLRAVPSEQQRLVAPPSHQTIIRHNKKNNTQVESRRQLSDLVNESQYLSSKLLQLIDYCTSITL